MEQKSKKEIQGGDPKVLLYSTDGWRFQIYFHEKVGKNTQYEFSNSTTGARETIKDSKAQLHATEMAMAIYPREFVTYANESILFVLDPEKPNKISGYFKQDGKTLYSLNLTVPAPASFVSKGKYSVLITEDAYPKGAVNQLLEVMDSVNKYLPDVSRVKVVLGNHSKTTPHSKVDIEMGFAEPFGKIFGDEKLLDDPLMAYRVFHEACHGYDAANGRKSKGLANLYSEMMLARGFDPYPLAHAQGKTYDTIDSRLANRLESDILISLFTESSYIGGFIGSYLGHPYTNEKELFASLTLVLKYFPSEMIDRLLQLQSSEPETGALARKIISEVINIWGNDRIFDPEIYKEFGRKK